MTRARPVWFPLLAYLTIGNLPGSTEIPFIKLRWQTAVLGVLCYCLTYPARYYFRFTHVLGRQTGRIVFSNGYSEKSPSMDFFRRNSARLRRKTSCSRHPAKSRAYFSRYAIAFLATFCGIWPGALRAEKLQAVPLSGAGDYEFLFFAAERKPEVDALTRRFREFDPELQALHEQLKKAEEEIVAIKAKAPGKKKQRIEWSAIEGVTGYSVKLFDAQKKLIDTQSTEDNNFSAELEAGEYFFQVAAVTKYKTGAYSRLTAFKVTRGKPGAEQLAAEEKAESLREKIKIQRSIRGEYLKTLRSSAVGNAAANDAVADVQPPATAAVFIAINKKTEPYAMSHVSIIPGRSLSAVAAAASDRSVQGSAPPVSYIWGAGVFAGPQDSGTDPNKNPYFRWNFGVEAFVRQDKAYWGFLRPQLKMQAAYSPAKSMVFDSLIFANLYPGIYYPMRLSERFTLVGSLGTGVNFFMVLSSSGSGTVLQWGVMPALEVQYHFTENMSAYAGGAINFTYDTTGQFLKFVPFNLGVTRRF